MSRAWTPRAKYFEPCKSLTHFGELVCDEHFGQISFKSDNSRLRLIHLNEGNTRKNKPRVFGLQRFSQFSRIIEVAVNVVIPPTNREQPENPLKRKRDKQPHSFAGKLIPRSVARAAVVKRGGRKTRDWGLGREGTPAI